MSQDDDIVVCPVCGTPQHRGCWQAHGACIKTDFHAEGFVWKNGGEDGAKSPAGFDPLKDLGVICPVCGTNNPAGTEICEHCKNNLKGPESAGNPISAPKAVLESKSLPFLAGVSPEEIVGGVKAYDIALYIQLSARNYINKFRKLDLSGKNLSWNWAAFIFSPYWFFYRKLYWLGGIFLGLAITIAILFYGPALEIQNVMLSFSKITAETFTQADVSAFQEQIAPYIPVLSALLGLTLLTHSAAALLANLSYKKKVTTDISSIKRFTQDENVFRMLVIKRGGGSFVALMGSFLLHDFVLYLVDSIVRRL